MAGCIARIAEFRIIFPEIMKEMNGVVHSEAKGDSTDGQIEHVQADAAEAHDDSQGDQDGREVGYHRQHAQPEVSDQEDHHQRDHHARDQIARRHIAHHHDDELSEQVERAGDRNVDIGTEDPGRLGLHFGYEIHIHSSVVVGQDKGQSRLAELTVHHALQVVGAAVLEQQQLLGDQCPVVGDTVILRPILVQGLVGLLQDVDEGDGFAHEMNPRLVGVGLREMGQLRNFVHHLGLVKPIFDSGVDDHFQRRRSLHHLIDQQGRLLDVEVIGHPGQEIHGETQPVKSGRRNGDDHDAGDHHPFRSRGGEVGDADQ